MIITDWQERTRLLLGDTVLEKLKNAHVFIAGVGGVGGYVAEQLCRTGVGKLSLVDSDAVQPSNRNRQIIAMSSTEGMFKTEVLKSRLLDINPELELNIKTDYLNEDNIDKYLSEDKYSVVVDAIDTLTPKVTLIEKAFKRDMVVYSSMGAAGKTDPTKVEIGDISESHHCKFAFMVRKYLHRRGIYNGIKVVYSPESVPKHAIVLTNKEQNKKSLVGTISYMPAVFGCYLAHMVVDDLISDIKK